MKTHRFITIFLLLVGTLTFAYGADSDIFPESAFGWTKYLEKTNARGTLALLPNGVICLKSSDGLLVRAFSVTVPFGTPVAAGERFTLSYQGRSNFQNAKKDCRGGMILLIIHFTDGTERRELMGARFTRTSDWKQQTAVYSLGKPAKAISLWCDLADTEGVFEIKDLKLTRATTSPKPKDSEVYAENSFGWSYMGEVKAAKGAMKSLPDGEIRIENHNGMLVRTVSRSIPINQSEPFPLVVSVTGKYTPEKLSADSGTRSRGAYITVVFTFQDNTQLRWGDGLRFTPDDTDWTLRRSVYYPSKPIKSLSLWCNLADVEGSFHYKNPHISSRGNNVMNDEKKSELPKTEVKEKRTTSFNPNAKWIWRRGGDSQKVTLRFRCEFNLPSKPVAGTLNFAADDMCNVFINGKRAVKNGSFYCPKVDAGEFLQAGQNCIAADVTNYVSQAGFLMYGDVTLSDGKSMRLTTGNNWGWYLGKEDDTAYRETGFDDSAWGNVIELNNVTDPHPWRERIELSRFMPAREYEEYNSHINQVKEKISTGLREVKNILSTQQKPGATFFVRKQNVPHVFVEGHNTQLPCLFYNASMSKLEQPDTFERIERLYQSGIRVFTVVCKMEKSWNEDGTVDISEAERQIMHLLAAAPEAYLIVTPVLDPPEWFVKKYPDELIGYGSGKKAVYDGDALATPLLRPSMASKLWLQECGKALDLMIDKLEGSLIGKRIIGYMPTYGIYSEWHYYGMANDMPDTGIPMQHAFSQYLKDKYKTDKALQAAWKDKTVTLDNARIPSAEARLARKNGEIFKNGTDCRVLDFDDCMALSVNRCQDFFNARAKSSAGRPVLVGNYSGYFFGMQYPAVGWQTRTPEMLNSKSMDFQVSPIPYALRKSGDSAMPRGVFDSYPFHGKVPIMEADTRTHLSVSSAGASSTCMKDTIGQLTREFCNAFTHGAAIWYYDFNLGWYDHPEYLNLFTKLLNIWKRDDIDVTRVSEVAVVCDFDSVPYHTSESNVNGNFFTYCLISRNTNELNFIGAPNDTILMEDLISDQAPKYKFYLFLNLVHITSEKEAAVRRLLSRGAKALFLCSPDLKGKLPTGAIFSSTPFVKRDELRTLASSAGVHIYCDDPDSLVFASRGFVGVHRKSAGTVTLELPRKAKSIQRVLPENSQMPPGNRIVFQHQEFDTDLFKVTY